MNAHPHTAEEPPVTQEKISGSASLTSNAAPSELSVRASVATLFTPNTVRGGAVRYRLYRHGPEVFSTTPGGKRFRAKVERDDCGLGCRCAAFITPTSKVGVRLLADAELFL